MGTKTDASIVDAWQTVCADLDSYGWECGAKRERLWAAPGFESMLEDARTYFDSIEELAAFAAGLEMGTEWGPGGWGPDARPTKVVTSMAVAPEGVRFSDKDGDIWVREGDVAVLHGSSAWAFEDCAQYGPFTILDE